MWICKGEVFGKRDLSPNVGMTSNQKPNAGSGERRQERERGERGGRRGGRRGERK